MTAFGTPLPFTHDWRDTHAPATSAHFL